MTLFDTHLCAEAVQAGRHLAWLGQPFHHVAASSCWWISLNGRVCRSLAKYLKNNVSALVLLVMFLLNLENDRQSLCNFFIILGNTHDYKIDHYNICILYLSPSQSSHISNSVLSIFLHLKHFLCVCLVVLCCLIKLVSQLKSIWTKQLELPSINRS